MLYLTRTYLAEGAVEILLFNGDLECRMVDYLSSGVF
jgi:hypothetical protein